MGHRDEIVGVQLVRMQQENASGSAEKSVHYQYVIGGVLYALLTRSIVDESPESQLVLDALRRSDRDLTNASEAELSNYLDSYDAEQLKGIANNVKGIYHERYGWSSSTFRMTA